MAAPGLGSHLESVVRDVADALAGPDRRWALVGGLAVSARTEPRFTRDVDVAVAIESDDEAEALVRDVGARGYRPLEVLEQERTGRLATVRLQAPAAETQGVVVDLLFASSGIEPEIARRASRLEVFPDLELPVAVVSDLLALKVLARDDRERPQDAADIRALLTVAAPAEVAAARDALELITERGYDRNRDLLAALDQAL